MYNNIYGLGCQCETMEAIEGQPSIDSKPLTDKGRNGKERPWRKYKMANEYLSIAYQEIDKKKADRLKACGKVLTFAVDENGNKKLANAESCRVRLCPLCSWRRSLKSYYNTMKIVDYINQHYSNTAYIFVTLTVQNCKADKLSDTLDLLFSALQRLTQRKEVKAVWRGSVRNLEVTHNVDINNAWYDTYHPHIHMLVAVNKSYFKDKRYISRAKLSQLWQECLRVDYLPQVDIRACKGSDAKAVAECSKYATKASDYLIFDDWDLTVETVRTLDKALANRRLINYSGMFRDVKRILSLDDIEDGDLVNIGENTEIGEVVNREYYFWYSGYRQYYSVRV